MAVFLSTEISLYFWSAGRVRQSAVHRAVFKYLVGSHAASRPSVGRCLARCLGGEGRGTYNIYLKGGHEKKKEEAEDQGDEKK